MDRRQSPEEILQEAFEDVAFVISGVAHEERLGDEIVWDLMRRLDRVRGRALGRLKLPGDQRDGTAVHEGPLMTHPAVEEFLRRGRPSATEARVSPRAGVRS